MARIREFRESDWGEVWQVIEPVFRAGETYPYAMDIREDEAYKNWITVPAKTYVAIDEGNKILGTYYIKPNQPGLGSHVCNCGYVVSELARAKGVASEMCKHSQLEAISQGFRSMQFNLVVSTNERAVRLWKRMGFELLANLPGAFNHARHGFVDAHIMYKVLNNQDV